MGGLFDGLRAGFAVALVCRLGIEGIGWRKGDGTGAGEALRILKRKGQQGLVAAGTGDRGGIHNVIRQCKSTSFEPA